MSAPSDIPLTSAEWESTLRSALTELGLGLWIRVRHGRVCGGEEPDESDIEAQQAWEKNYDNGKAILISRQVLGPYWRAVVNSPEYGALDDWAPFIEVYRVVQNKVAQVYGEWQVSATLNSFS